MDVKQQGAGGVAGVGDVAGAGGELPHQPAVDGAEGQLSGRGPGAGIRDVVEQPRQLGGGEIGVQLKAAATMDQGRVAGLAQALAVGNGAAVLPDDGGRQGAACGALPQHGGFTLVGDADGGHLTGGDACSNQGLAGAVELGLPDLQWVVLHPAGGRVGLVEFLLGGGERVAAVVEDEGPTAAGALVEGKEVGHGQASGR